MDPHEIRGRVFMMTYGLDLSRRVSDERVEHYAGQMIGQRTYSTPVPVIYEAILAALESGMTFAREDQREAFIRDYLRRLRDTLDARRPWPEPPYRTLSQWQWEWTQFDRVDEIAWVRLSESQLFDRMGSYFDPVPRVGRVLIVKLRDADTIVLRARGGLRDQGVALLAHTDDPKGTVEAFQRLCNFTDAEVVRVRRPRELLRRWRRRLAWYSRGLGSSSSAEVEATGEGG